MAQDKQVNETKQILEKHPYTIKRQRLQGNSIEKESLLHKQCWKKNWTNIYFKDRNNFLTFISHVIKKLAKFWIIVFFKMNLGITFSSTNSSKEQQNGEQSLQNNF